MTYRTVEPADYEVYLEHEYPTGSDGAAEAREVDQSERRVRLSEFPFSILLQVSYPELDYANRWSWEQFGPAHGECRQSSSEYPACDLPNPHSHRGRWLTYWLAKTAYDFGFNEWYFQREADRDRFLEFLPDLNWGEHYPK